MPAKRVCVLPIGAVAALAGYCRRSVHNALREARAPPHSVRYSQPSGDALAEFKGGKIKTIAKNSKLTLTDRHALHRRRVRHELQRAHNGATERWNGLFLRECPSPSNPRLRGARSQP